MGLSLLRKKDFGLLLAGRFVSMIGSNMQQYALALYVYAMTGSAFIFSSILAISILPRLIMAPIAGVFGDWFDRKRMIVRLDLINAVVLGIFAYIFFVNQSFSIGMIYILVIILEASEIFYEGSSAGIVPSIISKEKMAEARSLESMISSISRLISPMIAAVVYGINGLLIVLVINAISFLLSGISEIFIHVPGHHNKPEKINLSAFFKDVKEGLVIIKNNQFIRTLIMVGVVANFVMSPFFSVGFIVVIKDVLTATDYHYGMSQTVIAISMISAPIVVSMLAKRIKIGKLCVIGFFSVSALILLISIIPTSFFLDLFASYNGPFAIFMVLSFGIGISITIINISISTLFSQVVPIEAMGRTSTTLNLLITISIPLGQIIFGFLFDTIATYYVIMLCGLILFFSIMVFKKSFISSIDNDEMDDAVNPVGGQEAYEV